ncbi:MAG: YgiT-type zinc finger protein [Gammaproteobacteria bacterium]|nr:MAG: YgiT-type zinc finger protein [Gammaproteobacteria bacterium]
MKCPVCGKGQLKREARLVPFSYRGATVEVDQPGDWCDACGEGVLSPADLAATVEARRHAIVRAKGLAGRPA